MVFQNETDFFSLISAARNVYFSPYAVFIYFLDAVCLNDLPIKNKQYKKRFKKIDKIKQYNFKHSIFLDTRRELSGKIEGTSRMCFWNRLRMCCKIF